MYFISFTQIYGMQASAPCRIVEMTAEVLGLEYEFKVVDLQAGENMKPEYLALNPQHNIPYVEDGKTNISMKSLKIKNSVYTYFSKVHTKLYASFNDH